MEEKTYKCIKEFSLDKYDDDGFIIEDEIFVVPLDSIWERSEFSYMSDVRLEGNLGWLELDKDTLEKCFIEVY